MTENTPPPARKPKPHTVLSYKGTEEFEAWLEGLAEHAGFPITVLVDQALKEYSSKLGYAPPPRRTPPREKRRGKARAARPPA